MFCKARTLRHFFSLTAFTIRDCRLRTVLWALFQLMECQSGLCWLALVTVVTSILTNSSFTHSSIYLVIRHLMEVGSVSRKVILFSLNLYPNHYNWAFAFSIFLCPHY